ACGPRSPEAIEAVRFLQDLWGFFIQDLTDQMKEAATELQFELAARLRDEIGELKKELRQMMEATK
ncbi:MAG: UvrB/UvrC motif-containing protein, partial [Actinobacteria bacterium]|nr:UvrB/UvrC motif-containing protein [Actinomycetota bacterium]